MTDATVARRYAGALLQEAEAAGKTERIDEDVQALRQSLEGSRELARFFGSPVISRQKKQAVIARLFEGKLDALLVRLMQLLVEKDREEILPALVRQYAALRDERLGITEALVRTALPLGFEESEDLRRALEAATGQKVRMRIEIEPGLIGGLVVRVGDRVFDGSVRNQLRTLGAQLAERAYLSN